MYHKVAAGSLPTTSSLPKALKDFLNFAETGTLYQATHTGDGVENDFELSVLKKLNAAGFECEPQVGVAGFFIDLAVKDPGCPGRFLMGVECDGATYHSAKSVRDRDRLRQAVLERLGWRIERIWSTDWFRNPDAVLDPIIRLLNKLKTEVQKPTLLPDEKVETISDILDQSEEDFEVSEEISRKPLSLREKLVAFDYAVVREKYPNTEEKKRLLNEGMLNALTHHAPTTIIEFGEKIAPYLRHGIDLDEAEFLPDVFRIIAGAEVDMGM